MSRRSGSLVKRDALIQRRYFRECLRLYGIDGMYYQIKEGTKRFNEAGEFSAFYHEPIPCQMIFDQVPKISTLKKLGWTSELDEQLPLIHVDYDTPDIQGGCCFTIEDPLRPGKGRLFRVTKLISGIIYPMAITCQLVPVLGDTPENTLQPDTAVQRNKDRGMEITRPEGYK